MATQTGLQVAAPNEPYTVVDTIPVPVPGPKQVLVKSLVTGINPVEPMMQHTGSNLLHPFPAILGCEGSGVVVAVGSDVTRFKVGDGIFGCTRVGRKEYATFQERFLMDEETAYKRPVGMSPEEASTLGVALDTAMLGLVAGLGIELPEPGTKATEKEEWVIVLGGSGSVGAVAVQLARLAGYKVLASSSPAKSSVAISQGATATLDHTLNLADQVAKIREITEGKFSRVFDASARAHETAVTALAEVSTADEKLYSTANTWDSFTTPAEVREYRCKLGHMGQDNPQGHKISAQLAGWIPGLEKHLAHGAIKPLEYQLVPGKGWEAVIKAAEMFEKGVERKLAVRVQDE